MSMGGIKIPTTAANTGSHALTILQIYHLERERSHQQQKSRCLCCGTSVSQQTLLLLLGYSQDMLPSHDHSCYARHFQQKISGAEY